MRFAEAFPLTPSANEIRRGVLSIPRPDIRQVTLAGESSLTVMADNSIASGPDVLAWMQAANLKAGEAVVVRHVAPEHCRVSPDWRPFQFIDLFAGIGGIRLGLEAVGGRCVFSSEWDTDAQDTYETNFGERPHGDITAIAAEAIPEHDILAGGFPCQPFSVIGKRAGFGDTRGTLFFEIERILAHHRPTAVLLENVKQFRTHDGGRTCQTVLASLRNLGYHPHVTVLNALDFGVAQTRQRTFIVAFREPIPFTFPTPEPWRPNLADILDPEADADPRLAASAPIRQKRLERLREQGREPVYPTIWHENKGGHIGMHPYSCALRHHASHNYLLVNGNRRLGGREMLRLQGFPESYRLAANPRVMRSQAGNSVAVPVIAAIAAEMCGSLRLKNQSFTELKNRVRPEN
ncbi:DNA cytosine methyltransferase [Zavarzinella formosa]|uniref:DNA cytosine methyltransferase n=1 Tax=Zavarzinella formosa TaxID=360055 RepID=UPI0002E923FD|nr:DNA cytosine methyltransferase [Zavarzinella formosa]